METRSACVVVGADPAAVAPTARANRLGALVVAPGDRVIDFAAEFAGPVYDVMYSPRTGWFAVTIYRGLSSPERWDNRPGTNPGYPRVAAVLGASTPLAILEALDIEPALLGYAPA